MGRFLRLGGPFGFCLGLIFIPNLVFSSPISKRSCRLLIRELGQVIQKHQKLSFQIEEEGIRGIRETAPLTRIKVGKPHHLDGGKIRHLMREFIVEAQGAMDLHSRLRAETAIYLDSYLQYEVLLNFQPVVGNEPIKILTIHRPAQVFDHYRRGEARNRAHFHHKGFADYRIKENFKVLGRWEELSQEIIEILVRNGYSHQNIKFVVNIIVDRTTPNMVPVREISVWTEPILQMDDF